MNTIIVRQSRPKSIFTADNYFPIVDSSVNLINKSVESQINEWTLNDGVGIQTVSTLNSVITPQTSGSLEQRLKVSNGVSFDESSLLLYPDVAQNICYAEINVSRECARVDDTITISAVSDNIPSGTVFTFAIYHENESTPINEYVGETCQVTFTERGVYDIKLTSVVGGVPIINKQKKKITITPKLKPVGDAILFELTSGLSTYDGTSLLPGDCVILKLPTGFTTDEIFRLSLKNINGTIDNPIIITINQESPLIMNFNSYYGILISSCSHVIIDGKGYYNLDYGLHITKPDSEVQATAGISISSLSTNIQVFGVEISKTSFCGIFAKTDPVASRPETWRGNYVMDDLRIHHCWFHDTKGEGNYLGYYSGSTITGLNSEGVSVTYRAHTLNNPKIYRNLYERTGWDSLQMNNAVGLAEVCYNKIHNASIYPEQDQSSFMSMTLDGEVYNNEMINCGGLGIQFGTFTGVKFFNNLLINTAPSSSSLLLLSSTEVPEQYGTDGINTTSPIWIYNNTVVGTGTFLNAHNVVQFHNVHVFNNLYKTKSMFAGQSTDTIAIWQSQSLRNSLILDNGEAFKIANTKDDKYQIATTSTLNNGGLNQGSDFDFRGFVNWYESNNAKHVGAYSGYRKLVGEIPSSIQLLSFSINNGATSSSSFITTLNYTSDIGASHYMVSENSNMSGGVWTSITNPINYTFTSNGVKTLYFKIKTTENVESSIMSDSITIEVVDRIKIDFGASVYNITPKTSNNLNSTDTYGNTWNNLNSTLSSAQVPNVPVPVGLVFTNLLTTTGSPTNINIEVTAGFDNCTSVGRDLVDNIYPYSASRDAFVTNTTSTVGAVTLKNLDSAKTYTIILFGTRGFVDLNTIYTINGVSQILNVKDNTNRTIVYNNIAPVNNEITISVTGQTTFGFLNVMEVIIN